MILDNTTYHFCFVVKTDVDVTMVENVVRIDHTNVSIFVPCQLGEFNLIAWILTTYQLFATALHHLSIIAIAHYRSSTSNTNNINSDISAAL